MDNVQWMCMDSLWMLMDVLFMFWRLNSPMVQGRRRGNGDQMKLGMGQNRSKLGWHWDTQKRYIFKILNKKVVVFETWSPKSSEMLWRPLTIVPYGASWRFRHVPISEIRTRGQWRDLPGSRPCQHADWISLIFNGGYNINVFRQTSNHRPKKIGLNNVKWSPKIFHMHQMWNVSSNHQYSSSPKIIKCELEIPWSPPCARLLVAAHAWLEWSPKWIQHQKLRNPTRKAWAIYTSIYHQQPPPLRGCWYLLVGDSCWFQRHFLIFFGDMTSVAMFSAWHWSSLGQSLDWRHGEIPGSNLMGRYCIICLAIFSGGYSLKSRPKKSTTQKKGRYLQSSSVTGQHGHWPAWRRADFWWFVVCCFCPGRTTDMTGWYVGLGKNVICNGPMYLLLFVSYICIYIYIYTILKYGNLT